MDAISPLDGRYGERTAPLASCFSERALVGARIRVEAAYVLALDTLGVFPALTEDERLATRRAMERFEIEDFEAVKDIERVTRHDVKAVEISLRSRLGLRHPEMIHFGLTSEDVTNLAWSFLFRRFVVAYQLPLLDRLIQKLAGLARAWRDIPFPSHTHGQPASPTTAGKELAVFAWRLVRLRRDLTSVKFRGKLAGASGNYSAMVAAFPGVDWPILAAGLVQGLGLEHNPVTTQIEDHDGWAAWFDLTRRIDNVVIDLDRDAWAYISRGLFRQRKAPGQVGSSTMPHKVNPINFENSEGNLELANAQLVLLADKLCRSRMQRDLSDSTVQRNVGVAMAHAWLAWSETLKGLDKLEIDPRACRANLDARPELLGEPIQTILKVEGVPDPYELLRRHTQGRVVTREGLLSLLNEVEISPEAAARIRALEVHHYVGLAPALVDRVVREIELVIES